MKKMYFVFAFCCLGIISTSGQPVDVITGIPVASGLTLDGDNLYISTWTNDRVLVSDISQPNPTATEIYIGGGRPLGMIIYGGDLFVALNTSNKVIKLDISQPNPVPEDITTVTGPSGLSIIDDELYVSTFDNGIFKIDLTQPFPQTATQFNTNVTSSMNLLKFGDEVYYCDFNANELKKFNFSETDPVPTTVLTNVAGGLGMTLNGNFLYISENFSNVIIRVDLNNSNPTAETIVSGLNFPRYTAFNGEDMFFAIAGEDKVQKLTLEPIWSNQTACFNSTNDHLGGASPTGGTYSGTNVTDDGNGGTFTFDAATAGLGMHSVTYTINGLSVTSMVEVTAPPVATAVVDSNTTCMMALDGGLTSAGTGGNAPYTYLWSNNATTASITGVGAGTYTVTISDTNGCSSTSEGTVTEPTELVASSMETAVACPGQSTGTATASATGGTMPYTYLWSGGETTADISAIAAGTYTVTTTDVNGCTSTSETTLVEPTPIAVTLTLPDTFFVVNGVFPTNIGGGSPTGGIYSDPYSEITDDGNGMTFSFNSTATSGIGQLNSITYTVTDPDNGCTYSSSVNIFLAELNIPTPGDECPDANDIQSLFGQPLGEPQTSAIWDNTNYTTSSSEPTNGYECFGEQAGPTISHTIWYSFVGDGNTYRIKTLECDGVTNYLPDGDTQLAIYSGDDCGNLTAVACQEEDIAGTFNANLESFLAEAGVTYYMMIDGYDGTAFVVLGEFCIEVTLEVETSITDIDATNIELFPNPTSGLIEIQGAETDRIEVLDLQGRILQTETTPTNRLDISKLPSGIYFLKINVENQILTRRIVKE